MHVCVSSKGTHLVTDSRSQMYKMYSRLLQEHTQLHAVCVSDAHFPSKVNSRRRRLNVQPAVMAGSLLGGLSSRTAVTEASL